MATDGAPAGSGWMAATAGRYQTKLTVVTTAAGGWNKCLNADPRRWYVRFEYFDTPGGLAYVAPNGAPGVITPVGGTNLPREAKFRDEPSDVTGEWYSFIGGGFHVLITEVLYVGG